MNSHTKPKLLWQQPVADMWRKSTRAGQAWSDTTPAYSSVFHELWATEDIFAFRRSSWVFICLIISVPKHTLGICITTWQQVSQNCLLSCTFPACHLIIWDSPNPCIMRKCGYLFLSHPFRATPDFTGFRHVMIVSFSQSCFSQCESAGVCAEVIPHLWVSLPLFTVPVVMWNEEVKNQKCTEFRMGGTEMF